MSKKILIVEDEPFMCMLLRKILSKAGYTVVGEAHDGVQAIEMYKNTVPDLVIIDITMPTMNGIDATRSIKDLDPSSRILMCSAMGQEEKINASIDAGALGFVIKPFNEEGVLRAVAKAFKHKPGDIINLTHYAGETPY